MAEILTQRMTATFEGPEMVVFLIGARVNNWWKVGSWLPVARASTRIMKELESKPELGMMGYEQAFGRTTIIVQYWKSLSHLLEYAKARDSEHLPAWREFNQRIAKTAAVGIWHETYVVKPGSYESIYNNMPRFGLGRVGTLEPVGNRRGKSTEFAGERVAANAER